MIQLQTEYILCKIHALDDLLHKRKAIKKPNKTKQIVKTKHKNAIEKQNKHSTCKHVNTVFISKIRLWITTKI